MSERGQIDWLLLHKKSYGRPVDLTPHGAARYFVTCAFHCKRKLVCRLYGLNQSLIFRQRITSRPGNTNPVFPTTNACFLDSSTLPFQFKKVLLTCFVD